MHGCRRLGGASDGRSDSDNSSNSAPRHQPGSVWCELTSIEPYDVLYPTAQSPTGYDERFSASTTFARGGYVRWSVVGGQDYSLRCWCTNNNNGGTQQFGNIYAQATMN
jgi:hypothetical protein